MSGRGLSWLGIGRLGLAQAALGAVAAIATSTFNRVMVVELALPAIVPGLLVALHYGMQLLRPRLGHAADGSGKRAAYIRGGMAVMALGLVVAAAALGLMRGHLAAGLAVAAFGFALIGGGMGAMGTALLTVLSVEVAPARRAGAACMVWVMMIAGAAITAVLLGHVLQPFSFGRLLRVTVVAACGASAITWLATMGVREGGTASVHRSERFGAAVRAVWADRAARRFACFVFASMLAYSGEELLVEPFAGLVFHFAPAQSARLAGTLHGGVMAGMLLLALAGGFGMARSLRGWTVAGCMGSAACLLALAVDGISGRSALLMPCILLLGVANGVFAVSAVGSMMQLAGRQGRAGTSMGVWGAAQAVAFASGGLLASGASDVGRRVLASPALAYGGVFTAEAALFVAAASLAALLFAVPADRLPAGAMGSVP